MATDWIFFNDDVLHRFFSDPVIIGRKLYSYIIVEFSGGFAYVYATPAGNQPDAADECLLEVFTDGGERISRWNVLKAVDVLFDLPVPSEHPPYE